MCSGGCTHAEQKPPVGEFVINSPQLSNPFSGMAAWSQPPTVVMDCGASSRLPALVASIRARRVVVLFDQSAADGSAALTAALDQLGASVGVERYPVKISKPVLDDVSSVASRLRRTTADLLVGIGGGSTMDLTKLAAAAARNPSLLSDPTWHGRGGLVSARLPSPAIPFVLVPTTAATGSEVNCNASISPAADALKKLIVHPSLYARIAVVDPALTVTVPPRQTAEGALEILCRLFAVYANPVSASASWFEPWIEQCAGTTVTAADLVLREAGDLEARSRLSFAATMSASVLHAGCDPNGDTLWYLQNTISSRPGVTKGQALAGLLTAFLCRATESGQLDADRSLRFWESATGDSLPSIPDGAAAIRSRLSRWGLPGGLSELGIEPGDAESLARRALESWPDAARLRSTDDLVQIFADAIAG